MRCPAQPAHAALTNASRCSDGAVAMRAHAPSMPVPELTSDVLALSAVEQAALVRAGALSAGELVAASRELIARCDPALNAFTHRCAERALAEAEAIRPGDARPLCGVPIAIKDLLS